MASLSVANARRILTLLVLRASRGLVARLSWTWLTLWKAWPGRTDQLTIAPQELRTADATRAAEI